MQTNDKSEVEQKITIAKVVFCVRDSAHIWNIVMAQVMCYSYSLDFVL